MVKLNVSSSISKSALSACIQRMKRMPPEVLDDCGIIATETSGNSFSEFLSRAAGFYSRFRSNSSMFVIYDHGCSRIEVVSAAGELAGKDRAPEFPLNESVYLMNRAIKDLESVHVPDISGGIFGEEENLVEFHKDAEITERLCSSGMVFGLLPNGFTASSGSLLLTPLGIEGVADIALGFIQEYQPQVSFSWKSIQEARHYSAFFYNQIAELYVKEQDDL